MAVLEMFVSGFIEFVVDKLCPNYARYVNL